MSASTLPEPWLRGPIPDINPAVMPVFFSFQQVREDLQQYLEGLTTEQLWQQLPGGSLGFHLKHLAGSIDRISTYLLGEPLLPLQLQALKEENGGTGDLPSLLVDVNHQLKAAEERLRRVLPSQLYEARTVGRKHLPTTVLGLLVHLAEHTQRHLGQAITLANILRASKIPEQHTA